MKTTMETQPMAGAEPAVIKFKSRFWSEKPYACAVPNEPTEWFASEDARDLYARVMAAQRGFKMRGAL